MTLAASVRLRWALSVLLTVALLANAHPDFDFCYHNNVTTLDRRNRSDDRQCWFQNHTTGALTTDNRTYLSLDGCLELCGHGYQFWPWSDTARRFAFFILPLIVLAGKYAWVPLTASNAAAVFVHLIGDPIDSFWSLLTRQEKARRCYQLAMEIAPQVPREVAEIWMAYDQWWQDPTKQFESFLDLRSRKSRSLIKHESIPISRRTTVVGDGQQDIPLSAQPTQSTWATRPAGETRMIPDLLSHRELYDIKKAASSLSAERSSAELLLSWIAIGVFLASLTGAYIRTATASSNNQTAHTLAVVMLFSFLLFAVYISGHVGTFRSPEKVIAIIVDLRRELPDLFPEPDIETTPHDPESRLRYVESAPCSGLNSSWRPCKSLRDVAYSDRSRWTLLAISVFPILISWGAAFTLSWFVPLKGFGCRTATWTAITVAWILSVTLDAAVGRCIQAKNAKQIRRFWHITLGKDLLITIGSIAMVICAQVGIMNTCWCRASGAPGVFRTDKSPGCIDLGPVTLQQKADNWYLWLIPVAIGLLLMLGDIFWAGYQGENGRLLFHRTGPERMAEAQALENIKKLLDAQPPTVGTPGSFPLAPTALHIVDSNRDGNETLRHRGRTPSSPRPYAPAAPGDGETQHLLSPSAASSRGHSGNTSSTSL